MSLVKLDEISLREFIVRRHQLKRRIEEKQFILLISKRYGENNGFLAGVPFLPPPSSLLPPRSRVVSRPNSLPLTFRTPATQVITVEAVTTDTLNTFTPHLTA